MGERNSNYFFKLEKQRNHLNFITSLNVNGVVLQDHKEISNYCEEFYKKNLDTLNKIWIYFLILLTQTVSPKLMMMVIILCESPIQIKDISEATDKLKLNKYPGNDGLTTEFYKKCLKVLSPFLLQV